MRVVSSTAYVEIFLFGVRLSFEKTKYIKLFLIESLIGDWIATQMKLNVLRVIGCFVRTVLEFNNLFVSGFMIVVVEDILY